jgi:hypothetical protein
LQTLLFDLPSGLETGVKTQSTQGQP